MLLAMRVKLLDTMFAQHLNCQIHASACCINSLALELNAYCDLQKTWVTEFKCCMGVSIICHH
jgi:hypothetical protein